MLQTQLPDSINSIDEAKAYLKALYDNQEHYHCDDTVTVDYFGGITKEQCRQMNRLMEQVFAVAKGTSFDPCGHVLNLDPEYVKETAREVGSHLVSAKFTVDDSPEFEGYHDQNFTWNGYQWPYFNKMEAQKIVNYCAPQSRWTEITWEDENIKIDDREADERSLTFIVPAPVLIDGVEIMMYVFADWCWELAD